MDLHACVRTHSLFVLLSERFFQLIERERDLLPSKKKKKQDHSGCLLPVHLISFPETTRIVEIYFSQSPVSAGTEILLEFSHAFALYTERACLKFWVRRGEIRGEIELVDGERSLSEKEKGEEERKKWGGRNGMERKEA